MKSCPDEVILSRYFDGEEAGEVGEHVSSCLHCQKYLKELEGLDSLLSSAPSKVGGLRRRRSRRVWVWAAATLVLSVGLLWQVDDRRTSSQSVQTSSGKSYSVSVSDGVLLSLHIDGESVVRNGK